MFKGMYRYFLLIVFVFGIWNLLLGYFPFLIFLFFILIFLMNIFISFKGMKKTEIKGTIVQTIIARQDQLEIDFQRVNHTFYSTGKIVVEYRIFNVFSKCVIHKKIVIDDQKYKEHINLQHSGYYRIKIEKIYCYDILQCLYLSHKCHQELHFYVFPSLTGQDHILQETIGYNHESTEYSPYYKGEDYSEMFDLRNYRDQDSLRHIHWKASLKRDELLVKVGSQPIIKKILLAVETHQPSDYNDRALDQFYTLCSSLSLRQIAYEIICPHLIDDRFQRELIMNDEHFRECMKRILRTPMSDIHHILMNINDFSSAYIVTGEGIEVQQQ